MPLLTFPSPTGRPVPLSRQLKDLARHPFAGGALTAHMKVDAGTGERSGGLDAEGTFRYSRRWYAAPHFTP